MFLTCKTPLARCHVALPFLFWLWKSLSRQPGCTLLSQTINWDNKFKRTSELDDGRGKKRVGRGPSDVSPLISPSWKEKEPKTDESTSHNNKNNIWWIYMKQNQFIHLFLSSFWDKIEEFLLEFKTNLQVRSKNTEAVARELFLKTWRNKHVG